MTSNIIRRLGTATGNSTTSMMFSTKAMLALAFSLLLALNMAVRRLTNSKRKPKLSFSNGSFKILQLTDLHFGEEPSTDWGPVQDRNTTTLIRLVLIRENPDLVILSGDQLTGENVDANATVYYDSLANLLEEYKVPYALIFGNHDDTMYRKTFDNGTEDRHAAKTDRITLMRSSIRHRHSLSQIGPTNVSGVSNYVLDIHDKDDDSIKLQIMLLDSGGGSRTEEIVLDQLEWYRRQRLPGVAALAFQHIPTAQFRFSSDTSGETAACSGLNGEDGIAPLTNDPLSEVSYLQQYDPDLRFLAVGHNHGNSYCCRHDTGSRNGTPSLLHLCFGRHSGYGGYGTWERGARIYEMSLSSTSSKTKDVAWKSWVRLDSGLITDVYDPSTRR